MEDWEKIHLSMEWLKYAQWYSQSITTELAKETIDQVDLADLFDLNCMGVNDNE